MGIRAWIGQWRASSSGTIAVYMAVILPVLISSVAMSIDLAQAYLIKERLARAIDAAALAVAGSTELESEADILARVKEFMDANYPADRIGAVNDASIDIDISGNDITVSASAVYDTFFMSVVGIETITVYSRTTVRKQVKGVEAVLVLDNTGSMSYRPPGASVTNIEALRSSAKDFVRIMFEAAEEDEDVKIGVVPYANSVRIGRYGLGLNPDGTTYYDKNGHAVTPFVKLPSGVSYTNTSSSTTGWYGCVVEHMANSYYNASATHVAGAYGQLWSTATGTNSTKCSSATTCRGHGWQPGSTTNDPDPQDHLDNFAGPWDVYMYGRIIANNAKCSDLGGSYSNAATSCSSCTGSNSRCNATYCYCKYSTPSNSCPRTTVLPLTSNKTVLDATLDSMQAHGNTQGNAGLIWGYRMISPEAPFTEGADWGSIYWSKAIIMMTDGDNTMDGTYSYLWDSGKNNIDVDDTSPKGLNQRFEATCDELKAKDPPVLIYTIVFKSENEVSEDNKAFYRDCATNESMYFEAPTQADLQNVFQHIARELSNLHITE